MGYRYTNRYLWKCRFKSLNWRTSSLSIMKDQSTRDGHTCDGSFLRAFGAKPIAWNRDKVSSTCSRQPLSRQWSESRRINYVGLWLQWWRIPPGEEKNKDRAETKKKKIQSRASRVSSVAVHVSRGGCCCCCVYASVRAGTTWNLPFLCVDFDSKATPEPA